MKIDTKKITIPTLVLIIIIFVVAAALVVTYNLTQKNGDSGIDLKIINEYSQRFLPSSKPFEKYDTDKISVKNGVLEAFKASDDTGYAVNVISKGYGGDMSMLIFTDNNYIVKGIAVLTSSETPGLGTQTFEDDFTGQFIGKAAPFRLSKKTSVQGEPIDAVTGATISSKAIISGVNKGEAAIKEIFAPKN